MPSITIDFSSDADMHEFIGLLHFIKDAELLDNDQSTLLNRSIDSIVISTQYAIFVAGRKSIEGSLKDLNIIFNNEVNAHNKKVEIRELKDNVWVPIRTRQLNHY